MGVSLIKSGKKFVLKITASVLSSLIRIGGKVGSGFGGVGLKRVVHTHGVAPWCPASKRERNNNVNSG